MNPIVGDVDVREVLAFGLGGPIVALPAVYAASRLANVAFGDLVFGLTIVTCFGWILYDLNGRGGRRETESRSFFSRRSEEFREIEDASPAQLRRMARVLVSLTGAVLVGWLVLLSF